MADENIEFEWQQANTSPSALLQGSGRLSAVVKSQSDIHPFIHPSSLTVNWTTDYRTFEPNSPTLAQLSDLCCFEDNVKCRNYVRHTRSWLNLCPQDVILDRQTTAKDFLVITVFNQQHSWVYSLWYQFIAVQWKSWLVRVWSNARDVVLAWPRLSFTNSISLSHELAGWAVSSASTWTECRKRLSPQNASKFPRQ